MASAGNWIWRDNLEPLISEFERISGDELDVGVRKVFMDDIAESDSDSVPPRWAEQTFDGTRLITARLAADPGTQVIQVQVEAEEPVLTELRIILGLMNSYHLDQSV